MGNAPDLGSYSFDKTTRQSKSRPKEPDYEKQMKKNLEFNTFLLTLKELPVKVAPFFFTVKVLMANMPGFSNNMLYTTLRTCGDLLSACLEIKVLWQYPGTNQFFLQDSHEI